MKITDPQVIEDGEKDLIEAVREDLDQDAVRQIFKERMAASTLSSKGGQIVVHDNKIAFRLDFDINLSGSLLFDREGNYISDQNTPPQESETALDGFAAQDALDSPLSDETPLVETGLNEIDLDQQDPDETLSGDLPEFDLEDEPEKQMEQPILEDLEIPPLDLETDDLLQNGSEITEESADLATEDLELENLEEDELLQEERLDNDINDILKESREFWEQKKDS